MTTEERIIFLPEVPMRWMFLLFFALMALPVYGQDRTDLDLLKKPSIPLDISKFRLRPNRSHPDKYREPENFAVSEEPVCFTVRTYVVEREDPQSDVTRVVGSSNCQWSSRFAVKSALAPIR